jgi:hypothetical protein
MYRFKLKTRKSGMSAGRAREIAAQSKVVFSGNTSSATIASRPELAITGTTIYSFGEVRTFRVSGPENTLFDGSLQINMYFSVTATSSTYAGALFGAPVQYQVEINGKPVIGTYQYFKPATGDAVQMDAYWTIPFSDKIGPNGYVDVEISLSQLTVSEALFTKNNAPNAEYSFDEGEVVCSVSVPSTLSVTEVV